MEAALIPEADGIAYAADSWSFGGGAFAEKNDAGRSFAVGLAPAGAYVQCERIDGGRGGRAALYIRDGETVKGTSKSGISHSNRGLAAQDGA